MGLVLILILKEFVYIFSEKIIPLTNNFKKIEFDSNIGQDSEISFNNYKISQLVNMSNVEDDKKDGGILYK